MIFHSGGGAPTACPGGDGCRTDVHPRRLAELTGRSEAELRQLFEVSGGKALVSDQADYRRAGLHPPALNTSQELQQVLSAGLRQTQGLFTNLTRTTALDSGERFRAVLDRAWLQVSTGGFDANTAIRNAPLGADAGGGEPWTTLPAAPCPWRRQCG